MKKKREVEGLPLFHRCGEHSHFVGLVDGVVYQPGDDPNGEVVFDSAESEEEGRSKSSVGGGNPKYSAHYDKMNWNN